MGTQDPVLLTLAVMLLIPTLASFGGFLGAITARWKGERFSWTRYFNTLGLVFMVLYLAICMSMTRPIHCKSNPNGKHTMVTQPSVICWGPDHLPLVICSVTGLAVYGAGFLAYILQIVFRYPALVNSGLGLKLLTKYRFLFQRFHDKAYYWGCSAGSCHCMCTKLKKQHEQHENLLTARSCFLASEASGGSGAHCFCRCSCSSDSGPFSGTSAWAWIVHVDLLHQVAPSALLASETLYAVATSNVMPWATSIACLADILLNLGLLVFLMISAFLVETATPDTRPRE